MSNIQFYVWCLLIVWNIYLCESDKNCCFAVETSSIPVLCWGIQNQDGRVWVLWGQRRSTVDLLWQRAAKPQLWPNPRLHPTHSPSGDGLYLQYNRLLKVKLCIQYYKKNYARWCTLGSCKHQTCELIKVDLDVSLLLQVSEECWMQDWMHTDFNCSSYFSCLHTLNNLCHKVWIHYDNSNNLYSSFSLLLALFTKVCNKKIIIIILRFLFLLVFWFKYKQKQVPQKHVIQKAYTRGQSWLQGDFKHRNREKNNSKSWRNSETLKVEH